MTTARREALMGRAERYAADEMGWTNAEAVDARLDPETNLDAVLIDPGARRGGPGRFVVAFDQWGRVATDAGAPDDFGWDRPEEVAGRE